MAAEALRAKQAPIKQRYKDDPSAALVTLSASSSLDSSSSSITCKLDTGRHVHEAKQRIAGLHQKAGGEGYDVSGELCSGDMLLEALVACAGVTLKAVATALGISIKDGTVRAEGDLDFKGTLGVDKNAPVGITAIRLRFELTLQDDDETSEDALETLGRLTERYCVVLQTIAKKQEISVKLHGRQRTEDGVDKGFAWGQKA